MPRRVVVVFMDRTNLPRAWASGPASKVAEVRAEARQNLNSYIARKADVETLCVADFTQRLRYLAVA